MPTRKIAIVGGTGAEGYGLALRWARAGEHVVIGSRDEQRALAAAEKLQKEVGGNSQVSGAENQQAVAGADVVVLTVPFQAHAQTIRHNRRRRPVHRCRCRSGMGQGPARPTPPQRHPQERRLWGIHAEVRVWL